MRNNMKSDRHDGDVIVEFLQCEKRLKKFEMHISTGGYLAVVTDSSPHRGYVLNNVKDIRVISGFIDGLETAQKLQERIDEGNKNAEI
jgi:hypothetical protein